MKQVRTALALAISMGGVLCASADITAGWILGEQSSATKYFFDTDNWDAGEINGVFGASVDVAKYNVVLTNDWVGTFHIYGGPLFTDSNLSFLSGSGTGPHTIYVDGDMDFLSHGTKGSIVFGKDNSAKENLNFDLGGTTRTITMRSGSAPGYIFFGTITNGTLTLTGGGGTISLRNTGRIAGDVEVGSKSILEVQYATADTQRLGNLTLSDSTFQVKGANVDNVETIGTLTVDGSSGNGGTGVVVINSNNHETSIQANSLVLENGGILRVDSTNLGVEGNNASRVFLVTAPAAAGRAVPGVIVGPSSSSYQQSLAVYDSTLGLRAIAEDEYSAAPVAGEDVHLRVPAQGTVTINEDATVNSVTLVGGESHSTDTTLEGTGVLTVTSGQVYFQYNRHKSPILAIPLAFGSQAGWFYCGPGKNTYLKGPVSGTSGIVVSAPDKIGSSTVFGTLVCSDNATNSTYTGDTYIQAGLNVGATQFLPHGDRTGNVYLNGKLTGHWDKIGTPTFTINGLYGKGDVVGSYSSTHYFAIGDNNADGDFAGTISIQTTRKIGTGTQRFSGTLAGDGNKGANAALDITAGMVILDGAMTSAQGNVSVAAGAALGGNGSIAGGVNFAGGAKLAVTVVDGVASCLTVAGAVTGGPVTVNANVTGSKWRDAQCILRSGEEITATFVKGAGIGSLELRNEGTELWASPKVPGFTIIIR